MTRGAWSALAPCALAALSGCAALRPVAEAAPPPAPPSVQVRIEAPEALQRLLDTHLDIARLVRAAAGEPISENELRRLENATPAQARALLATEGYMDAEVRTQREGAAVDERREGAAIDERREGAAIDERREGAAVGEGNTEAARPLVRVIVDPGARTQVAAVVLQMRGPLGDEAAGGDPAAQALIREWQSGWTLPVGRPFANAAWRDAKNNALARLRASGYAAASWQDTAANVDADGARATLMLSADSGPRFHLGEIVVEGLERQQAASVLNLAELRTGAAITEQRLLDWQERIARTGLFEGVSVALDADPARSDAAKVTVRVREAPLQQATFGVGVSANSGARVSVEHLHRRLFGQRATLRNKIEWGTKRSTWEGELASHALPGLYRNLLGGAWESIESDTDRVYSTRVRLGRAYETQRNERFWFVQGEHERVRPFDTSTPSGLAARTDTSAATLNFHGTWRNLDSIVLPTRGYSIAIQSGGGRVFRADASGPVRPRSGPFGRLHARAQGWLPLGERWYGQARIELGQVFARDEIAVPESQRFRAGGDDSVRGYAWRSLTPQVGGVDTGGRVVATGSVEVARPVSEKLPSVWWATFIDAGRAADSWKGFSPAWGAGVGVRWRSPVGPLRADLAYGDEEKRWRVHFSVGIAF
jgi:translocation and assembly module TamA